LLTNAEFLDALWSSPTFWHDTVLWACLALAATLVALGILLYLRPRLSLRELLRDTRGAAAAVDFVLTIPIFLAVISFVIQFALLAHASLIVHYAAYSAARSARVWFWDRDTAFFGAFLDEDIVRSSLVAQIWFSDTAEIERRVELAGRFPLIAISPSKQIAGGHPPLDPGLQAHLDEVAAIEIDNQTLRTSAYRQKARYAYDPRMSTVTYAAPLIPELSEGATGLFESIKDVQEQFKPGDAWPVYADVSYMFYLVVPLGGPIFGTWQPDGYYARQMYAEVKLL